MKRGFLFFALFIGLISFAYAEGLSPARYEFNFNPGEKVAFPFQLVGGSEESYSLSIAGDLAQYAQLSDTKAVGGQTVIVYLSFPNSIDVPGPHRLSFIASRDIEAKGIGITGQARGLIVVHVPYPGKYLESSISATNANQGEPIYFSLSMTSRGKELIEDASASLEIFKPNGDKLTNVDLGKFSIIPEEAKTLEHTFDTGAYPSGTYRVTSKISYSGKESNDETSFKIGSLNVEIVNYTTEVEHDKINRFEIQVESGWNNKINSVFAQGSVPGTSISFSTPTLSLGPFQQSTLVGFFDTSAIKDDPFMVKVVLSFDGKASEKTLEVRFKKTINYLMIGLIVAGVLALIVAFFVVRALLRRKRNNRR